MNKNKRVYSLILAAILIIALFAGCATPAAEEDRGEFFTSFRNIPGVTSEEIAAIEELQSRVEYFVYGVNYGTEAFHGEDGAIEGFAVLITGWLSELFGIPFKPLMVEWDELIEGLENGTIDFTGELTANDERREKYFMTDDIVQREIIYIRVDNRVSLDDIAVTRALRYAFLNGSTTIDYVRANESREFEEFLVDDYAGVFEMLKNGEVDAFFVESPAEAAFDFFGEIHVDYFFPFIYSPVSLSTQNPGNKPVIDIVQKALDNGAIHHLTRLYNQGHQDYHQHKLFMLLTEEEREFIRSNPVIPFAAETTNYPISFYDSRIGRFEGIAHDVIEEMERLTGLTFERQNAENTYWPELLGMLESGEVSMITELIPAEDRVGRFLWAGEAFFRDHFVLVSKTEFPDININEILYLRTGVARNTAHSTLYQSWFINHRGIYEYENTNEALDALERGEIDVVITSEHQLLIMTNYREQVGYKANFVFPFYFDSTFGFNKDEEVLSSIVTKTMRLIDLEGISNRWLRKTYDYSVRLAQERIPFMIGVGMLSVGLVFALILFIRKRREGQKLENLVETRTKELTENQRQLQEMLLTNEVQLSKLNLMVKAAKIVLWDMEVVKDDPVNPDNTFVWSKEIRSILGYTDETDLPNTLGSWNDLLHPDDREKTFDEFERHLSDTSGKTPYDIEYRLRKKDGEYAYFRDSGETIRDEEGRALHVAGALLEITETKNLLHELETESTMLQTMFDSVPDLIFCKDKDLNYTRCNKSLLEYFNFTEEDLLGKDDENGLRVPEETAREYRAMDRHVMREKKTITYEEYVPSPAGENRLFETNKVPLLLNGEITGIMGIAREITERKAMEDAAQSANKAKSEFLANMSHEIRTPMNTILGMSEILVHEGLSDRQMSFAEDINNSAHSLLEIINDILDMSKIEAGKLELHAVDYNFNQFMDNIVSMFTHVAGRQGLDFIVEIEDEVPDYLYGDDLRLRQILTNICGNAVKYTEEGYVKLVVLTRGDNLVFMVEDTGAGIKKENLPMLFNAFEQVDKNRHRNIVGTGLGLPICKSFIEMMNGEISVESEYGFGSVFTVTIPIILGDPEKIQKTAVAVPEQVFYAPDADVLITDDNEFNRKVASGLLSLMGIDADTADSGAEAIKLVKQNDYDIVFMDHMMPGKDGIETVHEIRELGGKYKNLTIIALTANAVIGAREMFLDNGFDDFIAKPINTEELRDIVKRNLPPEKIREEEGPEEKQARSEKEEKLFRKSVVFFVKENKNTSKIIAESLKAGDIETAHRTAHTLKSSAGYLNKKELQEAAFSLEQTLKDDPTGYTQEQLDAVGRELEKALLEFEPLIENEESKKPKAVQVSDEELSALLAELEPLLEKGDFSATEYVDRLYGIAGMEMLAERVDNYDFESAYKLLKTLRNKKM